MFRILAVFAFQRKALLGTQSDPGTSCLDLKQKGKTESGYYYLKSDRVNSSYQVRNLRIGTVSRPIPKLLMTPICRLYDRMI